MIKPLYEYPIEPMCEDNSKLLMQMLIGKGRLVKFPEELKKSDCYRIVESRNPIKVDDYLIGFVAMLCDSPGKCVQWAHTLHSMGDGATLDTLVKKFPMGFPSEASYRQAWSDQKDEGTNKLDNMENW